MTPARANILGRLNRDGSVAASNFTAVDLREAHAAASDGEALYLTARRRFFRVPNTGIALRNAELPDD